MIYRLLRYGITPPPWMPGITPLEYEAESHAVELFMGGMADVSVCGRSTSGAVIYPEQGDAEWTAKLVGCGECAKVLTASRPRV